MRIAETIDKQGISAGSEFMDELTRLVATERITRVIETGTCLGLGTTTAVLNGIDQHGLKPVSFVSIEVNPANYKQAVRNLKGRNVTILNGLSIPKELRPKKEAIVFDGYSDDTIVDHFDHNRAELYYNELDYNVPDRQLDKALLFTSFYPSLVILDSAGHIGTVEFEYLMSKVKGSFYLALDDTNHVKHSKTVQLIETDNRFTLTFSTEQKFGSRIYAVQT